MAATSRRLHVLLLALIAGCPDRLRAEPSVAASQQAVVLITRYADGRTTHSVVTASPRSSWTPMFPRLPGWRPAVDEPAISALKFTRTLEGGMVRVGVAVLRGVAREREDAIATVIVGPDHVVTIEALREIGVAPVTLSITALADSTFHPPQVVNKTAGLEVTDVELVMTPRPRYRISVTNVSVQPAVNFHVVAHRGGRRSLSGNRGNPDASPILPPGGTYSFDLDPSSGPPATAVGWSPVPHDVVEIAAVLWEDGTIEGDAAPMADALNVYLGRCVQLTRGLALFQAAQDAGQPPVAKARLRDQIEQLPIEPDEATQSRAQARLQYLDDIDPAATVGALRAAMADTRKGMLDDLAGAPDDVRAFQRWLSEITTLYAKWRERFATR